MPVQLRTLRAAGLSMVVLLAPERRVSACLSFGKDLALVDVMRV
jgi:hypothetical protein